MIPLSDGIRARSFPFVEANFGLFSASANGGGTAFFAHVGGFAFGFIVARLLTGSGLVAGAARAPTAVSAGV